MPSVMLYREGKPMILNASSERRCCGSGKLTSVTKTGELVFATGSSSVPFQDLPIVRDVWRPLALINQRTSKRPSCMYALIWVRWYWQRPNLNI